MTYASNQPSSLANLADLRDNFVSASRALHQTDRGTIERRTILAQLDRIERQMCMALQFPTYP
jgi:hypothetical protein